MSKPISKIFFFINEHGMAEWQLRTIVLFFKMNFGRRIIVKLSFLQSSNRKASGRTILYNWTRFYVVPNCGPSKLEIRLF
jgi:hypothetical protein